VINNYSRTSVLVLMLLLVACAPSVSQIQTAVAKTQAALPTITLTNTQEPTPTSIPTKLPTITVPPQVQKTLDAILVDIAAMLKIAEGVDSVTTIRPGNDSLEIELKTMWASKDMQPNVSFEAIQLLALVFGNASESKALNFVTGNPQHFSILLTTYSVDGEYKYSSLTYYDTLIKLYNKRITYDEWVNEAKAGFVN